MTKLLLSITNIALTLALVLVFFALISVDVSAQSPSLLNEVESGVESGLTEGGGLFKIGAKIMAFVAPYAAIPLLINAFAGFFGTITGRINNAERGLFDRQRKKRSEARQTSMQRAREGKWYKNGPEFLNRRAQRTALQKDSGFAVGKARRARTDASVTRENLLAKQQMLEKNSDYAAWKHFDNANKAASLWAQSGSSSKSELKQLLARSDDGLPGLKGVELDRTAEQIMAVRRQVGKEAFIQATALQTIAGGTAIKSDKGTNNAAGKAAKFISDATRGDASARSALIADYRSAATKAGRMEQGAAGFGDTLAAVEAFDDPAASMEVVNNKLMAKVTEALPAGHAVHGKPESSRNIAMQYAKEIVSLKDEYMNAIDPDRKADIKKQLTQKVAFTMGIQDAMNQAAPQNGIEFADVMNSAEINFVGDSGERARTIGDLAKSGDLILSSDFTNIRGGYAAATAQQAAQFKQNQALAQAAQQAAGTNFGPGGFDPNGGFG